MGIPEPVKPVGPFVVRPATPGPPRATLHADNELIYSRKEIRLMAWTMFVFGAFAGAGIELVLRSALHI